MTVQQQVTKALERLEPRIKVDAVSAGPNIIKDAISQNPRLAYYINGVLPSIEYGAVPKLVLDMRYSNTDVPISDIYIPSSDDEMRSILCRYAGNYKKKVVFFTRPGASAQEAYNKFTTKNAPFYPSLVNIRVSQGMSSMLTMPFYTFEFDYRLGKVKLAMMENEMDAEIARISKLIFVPGMPPQTKVLLAHNYLAYTIKYDLIERATPLEKSYMHSAYGALINKKCVCQGYAEAFKRMLDYIGVSCDIVCGTVRGYPDYHAWNIVRLNRSTDNYHIDVTWDSTESGVSYDYFGLKDSDFIYERTWNRDYNARCNSDKQLYAEARRGLIPYRDTLISRGISARMLGY